MRLSLRHAIYGKHAASVNPDDSLHSHLCNKCKHIWSHPDSERGNKAAHSCPSCGTLLGKGWPQLTQARLEQLKNSGAIKL